MQNYYEILGTSKDATQDEIKKAYRQKSKMYHPDINKSDNAEAMMKKVNQAYDVLGDPAKRQQYDTMGSNPYQNQGGQQYYGRQTYTSADEFFEEFMRQFYGQQQQRQQYYQQQPRRRVFNPLSFLFRMMFGYYIINFIMNILAMLFAG